MVWGVASFALVLALALLAAVLLRRRHESLPVSRMWQWWVMRSSSAVVILASPNTCAHSEKARLVVMTRLVRS